MGVLCCSLGSGSRATEPAESVDHLQPQVEGAGIPDKPAQTPARSQGRRDVMVTGPSLSPLVAQTSDTAATPAMVDPP